MTAKYVKVRSPGRINIIGEHTDYQKGLVFPACIDKEIIVYANQRPDNLIMVFSNQLNDVDTVKLKSLAKTNSWKDYHRGIISYFKADYGCNHGFNLWIDSTLPTGSGLSSSAALELAILKVLERFEGIILPDIEAIKMAWQVENEFVGVSCGIMDQYIIRKGLAKQGLKIDCSDLSSEYVPIGDSIRFLVFDTKTERKLSESAYNQRVEEVQTAVQQFQHAGVDIDYLGQLTEADFRKYSDLLDTPQKQRVKHIVSENQRVKKVQHYLETDQLEKVGTLLYESHASLREDYEASWSRADELVEICRSIKGIYGARMTGAGWGGSVLILINKSHESSITSHLREWFSEKFDEKPIIHSVTITDGVEAQRITQGSLPVSVREFLK